MRRLYKICLMVAMLFMIMSASALANQAEWGEHKAIVKVYIHNIGWRTFYDGDVAGTIGEHRYLEGLSIKALDGTNVGYRVYIDGKGWSKVGKNGEEVGIVGEKKAITAIQLFADQDKSKITCKAYVRYVGELTPIEANGEIIEAYGNQIEAIKVNVVPARWNDPNDGLGGF